MYPYDQNITAAAKVLLLYFRDRGGEVLTTGDGLAKDTGLSRRTLERVKSDLTARGLINHAIVRDPQGYNVGSRWTVVGR